MVNFAGTDFRDKSVIVTGGGKGIGRATCLAFANAGAKVLCADLDDPAGADVVAAASGLSGEIVYQHADVSTAAACKGLVDWAVANWGGVDVLINNVGIQPLNSYLPAHELPEEMWDRIINVNLKSGFLMTKYAAPVMTERGGGVIINTASVQGLQSAKGIAPYAASKGGMLSLTRQLALEYAADNIRVLAVNPGTIETPLAAAGTGNDYEKLRQEGAAAHPMGRIGKPEEIASVMLFLASDSASFMTGEFVNVDGGMMAKGAWAE